MCCVGGKARPFNNVMCTSVSPTACTLALRALISGGFNMLVILSSSHLTAEFYSSASALEARSCGERFETTMTAHTLAHRHTHTRKTLLMNSNTSISSNATISRNNAESVSAKVQSAPFSIIKIGR